MERLNGLDHTWFRKHENRAGRWTSPDPYGGSMQIGDPQTFNRYSYVSGQPTNFIDPSGLFSMESQSSGYCIRNHYFNPATGEGFWGPWICYGGSGGSSGEGGIGSGNGASQKGSISQDCIDALKGLGIWDKVQELLKNPPVIDINTVIGKRGDNWSYSYADLPGESAFGIMGLNRTVGESFDSQHSDAVTFRPGSEGGVAGIYARGLAIFGDMYLLLHEVTHLAYPPDFKYSVDLDQALVRDLEITQKKGESYSDTVSRFFNNKCDPSQRHFGVH